MAVNLIPKSDSELLAEIDEAGPEKVFFIGCPYCTALSYALKDDAECPTYVEFTLRGPKFTPLEGEIARLTEVLGDRGIGALGSYFPLGFPCYPLPYMLQKYRKKARDADTVLVLGCENARRSAANAFEGTKDVLNTMRYAGYSRGHMRLKGRRLVVDREDPGSLGCRECVARKQKKRRPEPPVA